MKNKLQKCAIFVHVFVSAYVCVPVHAFDIFFQKARNYEMGKFLSGFTFSLLVCREKQTKSNAQKVRRCKLKVEILLILWWFFVLFWVFGCLGFFFGVCAGGGGVRKYHF